MERMRAATHRTRSFGDLLQEFHVGVVENSDIRDSIPAHGHTNGPHAERPSCVALTIDTRGVEHGRVNHARPEDLQPTGSLAGRAAGSATNAALHVHLR